MSVNLIVLKASAMAWVTFSWVKLAWAGPVLSKMSAVKDFFVAQRALAPIAVKPAI